MAIATNVGWEPALFHAASFGWLPGEQFRRSQPGGALRILQRVCGQAARITDEAHLTSTPCESASVAWR